MSISLRKGFEAVNLSMNPVREGLVNRPEDWRWSSYNNFAFYKRVVAACPIQIDDVHLLSGYRA